MPADLSQISSVPTPATTSFLDALGAGDSATALRVLDRNWAEIWYAVDPTDLKDLLLGLPREAFAEFRMATYVNGLVGIQLADPPTDEKAGDDPMSDLDRAAQTIVDLRLAGKPLAAAKLFPLVAQDARELRGRLLDTSGGSIGIHLVQAGITSLLAGDLATARAFIGEVTNSHRPIRFPFITREAAAKLSLVHAIAGDLEEAQMWGARAEELPRTLSWVEKMIDDTLWLVHYICAIDSLDLERAESMRRENPSPLSHLEFWGVALLAHVRHLCLTGRERQALALCDETASVGLPLPDSDGWVAAMLNDALLMCSPREAITSARTPTSPAEALLGRRLRLLATGQFEQLAVRDGAERNAQARDARTRLGLLLLRGQGQLLGGQQDSGRHVVLAALEEAARLGTLSVLRLLTREALDLIADTPIGARAAELVAQHDLRLVEVVAVLESSLTPAEMKVLRMLGEGLSRAEIAQASYVSVDTVKSQLASVYRKLGVRNKGDAIAKLDQLGW
ncbi:response regulator transcription factor [Nocardioides alcanivorans]|uniref:response regulator transcription factor n=1 Tax=Nocardioides alcanivorans TaxID=2897352 RepID=UPI001F3D85AF|nr:LuxR C-terminal-related transcriptional regulator [Nocardioides alcanivorans]